MNNRQFLDTLTPTQEHFLKKFLIEKRLDNELQVLNKPECLQLFGDPFKSKDILPDDNAFPLLRFFFRNYLASFPFITNNTEEDQQKFWQDTVQPFIESLNTKQLSNSNDRKENITKRKQINLKFLSGMSLFFNSMLVTEKDMIYLQEDHLRPSDVGKLDKIKAHKTPIIEDLDLTEGEVNFTNDINLNIVGVQRVNMPEAELNSYNLSSWWSNTMEPKHHFEFLIQVTVPGEKTNQKHYVLRPYHEFKHLEKSLIRDFPGIMNIETSKLPEKFKNDTTTLVKEKLRLSLRGYLNQLIKFPDIINSHQFQWFINDQKFYTLTKEQNEDHELRLKHEQRLLLTQLEFQKHMSKIMIDFSKRFDEFKLQLIKEPNTLGKIFHEIGSNENMENLSPLLGTFIEWCKIEVSSTIFQIFLTQDNSNELLKNAKKFHRLFPYSVMYNILRFTNPMSIISKVINLLLVNFPGTKNKNLLSMIFVMLLDDDLSGYEKEINEVKSKMNSYPNFIKGIEGFIDNKLIDTDMNIDQNIKDILDNMSDLNEKERELLIHLSEDKDLYNNLKQLYQLKIRQNDKIIMKALWEEPELTQLLKNFLIIFYQPLIKLLSRSKMHVFFKEYQKFNDELIELLETLNEEEIYYLSSVEIFNKVMNLVDKHLIIFWRFVHNLYKNDRDELFLKLIEWIENFLLKLRLKYVDIEKVKLQLKTDQPLDQKLFMNQLNERMNKILLKRRLFKLYYEKATSKQNEKNGKPNTVIDDNWDMLHRELEEFDGNFGLDLEELQEVNFDINNTDLEFQQSLEKLNDFKYDTSELDKFDNNFIQELNDLFKHM